MIDQPKGPSTPSLQRVKKRQKRQTARERFEQRQLQRQSDGAKELKALAARHKITAEVNSPDWEAEIYKAKRLEAFAKKYNIVGEVGSSNWRKTVIAAERSNTDAVAIGYPDYSPKYVIDFHNEVYTFPPDIITHYDEGHGVAKDETLTYTNSVEVVRGPNDLAKRLAADVAAMNISPQTLQQLSETAWHSVITSLAVHPGPIQDPKTGLLLPPSPRATAYQSRPMSKLTQGRRMDVAEYLSDASVGWGNYTSVHMLSLSSLLEIDEPLHAAVVYRARIAANHAPNDGRSRSEHLDEFYLSLGLLTAEHLQSPPQGYERQANILNLVRKIGFSPVVTRRTKERD